MLYILLETFWDYSWCSIQEGAQELVATIKAERAAVTDAQFAELFKQHQVDINAIRRAHQGERSRHEQILAERLARKGRSDVSAAAYEDTEKVNKIFSICTDIFCTNFKFLE